MKEQQLLLKAAEIEAMQGELKTHFLNPNAVRLNKSLGDAVGMKNMGVHIISVEPGRDTTEYHIHYYEEECLYVLSGRGQLNLGGEFHVLEKGDFVGFPAGKMAHNITNDGTENLVCLVMGQRLQHDVGDYPDKKKRIYRNSGEWNVVELQYVSDPRK